MYTKRKTAQHGTDAADRTCIILQQLPRILRGPGVDYLYVDEVQDNLMIDIYLLRKLAKNVDGIYWSGDSAQTIIAGSSFRINDLKAFTYQEQVLSSSPRITRKSITSPQFTKFDLNVNFRSLSGIVRFSRSLVEAIHKFFPQTIDPMEPEKAKQYGDPPVVFTNIQNEPGYLEHFLLGSSASNRVVFGAQQAILVRDTAAAEELDDRLQGLCNVLPIMDRLEFDDVLIYNFFSTSPAPITVWSCLSRDARLEQPPPPVLCSELKLLYVAVTRARRRCWIWDSGQLIHKLLVTWTSDGLVNTEPASRMIGRLAASSSRAQWSDKGREYFSHRLYKLAAACFRQAGQFNNSKLSTAYHRMSRAKLKRLRSNTPDSREELAAAAEELDSCAELPGIGDSKNVYFHAATCFRDAEKLLPAATAFVKAGQATEGINMLLEAREYKHAANFLVKSREVIETDVFEELREPVRVYFFEHREYGRLSLVFDTFDEKITYARERKYKTHLKYMLAEAERYDELAEEHVAEDNLTDGVAYFIKAYENYQTRTSIIRAVEVVIGYTESVLLVEGTYRKNDQDLAKSLVKTIRPFVNLAGGDSSVKIDLFYTYLWFDYVSIHIIQAWDRANPTHQYARTLASYLLIKRKSWPRNYPLETLLEYIGILKSYKADIMRIIRADQPCALPFAQKLLGFTPIESPSSSLAFTVLQGSLINHAASRVIARHGTWSGRDIDAVLREELPKRLNSLIASWHSAALALNYTQPLHFAPTPYAHSPCQSSQAVADPTGGCAARIHVISKVLETLDVKGNGKHQTDYAVSGYLWLERIYEIIHLVNGELGSIHSLRTVPDFEAISGCLRDWLTRSWAGLFTSGYSADSVTQMLLHFLVQSSFQGILFEQNNTQIFPVDILPNHNLKTTLVQPIRELFFTQGSDRLNNAIEALVHLLNFDIRADIAVMIHFIELLTRKVIVCMNPERQTTLDGLLLPFSWTRVLARQYRDVAGGCSVGSLNGLCLVIKRVSNELRFGALGRSKQLGSDTVDLLNLRLCWCIALVIGHMEQSDSRLALALNTLRAISSEEIMPHYFNRGFIANKLYRVFTGVSNQRAALVALDQTFRHESLVLVLKNSHHKHPAKFIRKVRRVVYTEPAELIEKLDQLESSPNSGILDDGSSESGEDYPLPAQPNPPRPPAQTPQIQQIQPQEQTTAPQDYTLHLIFLSFLLYLFWPSV
ncbi:unnamed protein product [Rhizoctonia solani]|uniref:UvrD-like helicase ATP-binding domain-containing protein n=1 Tax=Rhizoctonia solani TaxID=456999 RepID=A0A8H3DLT8_9AGAM|nr:unnamed protein product [Rhizoctonia solani]